MILAISAVVVGGLALWLWPNKTAEEDPFVTIFKTGDPGQVAFIKSLFEDQEIPCLVNGERVQDLFGMGRLGAGYNIITGPVIIQVPASRQEEAVELLRDLEESLGHS